MLIAILNTTEFAQMKDSFDFYKSSHQRCSIKKFRSIQRKSHVLESLFNKVVGLQASNFIKKRLQHRRFTSVNIVKICKRLLLFLWNQFLDLFKVELELLQNVLKNSFLKKFIKFQGKYSRWYPFIVKLQTYSLWPYQKRTASSVFPWNFVKLFGKKAIL